MSRYERMDNGSPVQQALKSDEVAVGRTAFDFSRIHVGNALIGALIPVDCFDVVPNEDIDLNLISLLEFRNPTVRQIYNGFRVFFHAYYNRLTDLWEGARNFLDKGRSGNISLTRPNLIYSGHGFRKTSGGSVIEDLSNYCTPLSLLNYLGLPSEFMQDKYYIDSSDPSKVVSAPPLRSFQAAHDVYVTPSGSSTNYQRSSMIKINNSAKDFFPADCAFAYQKNWRDFYSNKNLMQDDKTWFPDNEDHFILSYNASDCVVIDYENEDCSKFVDTSDTSLQFDTLEHAQGTVLGDLFSFKFDTYIPSQTYKNITFYQNVGFNPAFSASLKGAPVLSALKFRQFRGDRFTTSSPFPDLIRGDLPVLDSTQSTIFAQLQVPGSSSPLTINGQSDDATFHNVQITRNTVTRDAGFDWGTSSTSSQNALFVQNPLSSVTMSDIYTLETLTAFKRKMGLTNGDYNEMIKSQYGVDPHTEDRCGTYIGGFYQDFAFNSVTQTSESASTPLGTKAGQGISSGNGNIGHFHTPDFGWIQIYMSIVPDVFYTQGKPRMFSKKSALEMYFPLFNNLPAQAIRNDELYVSASSTDSEQKV